MLETKVAISPKRSVKGHLEVQNDPPSRTAPLLAVTLRHKRFLTELPLQRGQLVFPVAA